MTDNLEQREVELELRSEDERVVTGYMVPFNEVTEVRNVQGQIIRERFEHGAVDTSKDIYLYQLHDHTAGGFPVGRVTETEIRGDHLWFAAQFDNTDKGDAAYADAKARRFKGFSVGFEPIEQRIENGIIVRTKVAVKEVSLVPRGAYKTAELLEVRSDFQEKEIDETKMNEELNETVEGLKETVSELERRVAVNEEKGGYSPARVSSRYNSLGQLYAGIRSGDNQAELELRAYTGATLAGDGVSNPQWVNETIKLVEERRPLVNRFRKGSAPAALSMVYPKVEAVVRPTLPGTTLQQLAEGDDLGYTEVQLDTGTISVKTFGTYGQLTKQILDLGTPDHLDALFRYQAFQYAKDTESYFRDVIVAATGTSTALLVPALDTTTDADTAVLWTRLVRNASRQLRLAPGNPTLQFGFASSDVIDRISDIVDEAGRPVFAVSGQAVNSVGGQNLVGAYVDIQGTVVFEVPELDVHSCYFANAEAATSHESAGAPVRLTDENIVNLSRDYSLHGYFAGAVTNPKSIVKCDVEFNEA